MNRIPQQFIGFCWALLAMLATVGVQADEAITPEQLKFFESNIRPVLVKECYSCHSTEVGQVKGGLWLDTVEGIRTGGDSGPAVVPGDLDESLLLSAINHDDFVMPPRKKLPDSVIADFQKWIEMGAPDPRLRPTSEYSSTITEADIKQGREFWSFQPPRDTSPPGVESDWAETEIDQFIFAKLVENGLQPSPDAEPATILRRLTIALIGLPPTPDQVERFQDYWDDDPQAAIEKVVDYLLARPQFGERWARHWLDVARYAESSGKEVNMTYPQAWRYRDYVIDAFNDDKPYDRFVQEQIAGDLLPVKTDQQWAENLIATGFLAMGPKTLTEQNARQFEYDLIDEQIDVTTRVMLGVSVACARCHDHKFDPIPQSDYYAMAGIFGNMTTHYGTLDTQQNRRPSNLVLLPVDDLSPWERSISSEDLENLRSQLTDARDELRQAQQERRRMRTQSNANPVGNFANVARASAKIGALESKIASFDEDGNPMSFCMAVQDTDRFTNSRLLERGEFNRPAQEVERGFPQVLCAEPIKIESDSSGRLEFARWVGSESNPLAARVMVNRVWLHLFGNGIVRTPEDFGSTGLPPTHPELLDHLTVEFTNNGWSVKKLIRSIVLSRVYRMSSQFDQASFESDPENKYLWRMEPRRIDAEVIRDSMLAISGQLDLKRPRASLVAETGTAIARDGSLISSTTSQDSSRNEQRGRRMGMRQGRNPYTDNQLRPRVTSLEEEAQKSNYRSIYLPIVRDQVPRSLAVLDFAESTMVVGQRESSNTPDQGLYFLNNPFVLQQADAMAQRLAEEADSLKDQLKLAFQLAYGRDATSSELRTAESFYRRFRPEASRLRNSDQHQKKLSAVCQSLMAAAEFRFVD